MSTITRLKTTQALAKLTLIVISALSLQFFCSCAAPSGDEEVANHAIKYAYSRSMLDMASSSAITKLPDTKIEISLLSFEDTPNGEKAIELEPAVISDTMASWGTNEWAANRDDLYFNLGAHFSLICKQAREMGDIPEGYTVTCPDYMVVYDSQKSKGFIVSPTGVYQKTDDPENPVGNAIVLTAQS